MRALLLTGLARAPTGLARAPTGLAPALAGLGLALAACGAPDGGMPLSAGEALERGEGEALVEGYLFADRAGVRLCEAIAESYPPQCGGPALIVRELDLEEVEGLEREGEQYWSDAPVRLRGRLDGGTLTVSATGT